MMEATPHTIFLIPYRDRETHKKMFLEYLNGVKQHNKWNDNEVKEFFIHQTDKRPFNRGAMKNIGFLFVKNLYPNTYKNITLIFHDVDTIPCSNDILPYKTQNGVVAHYYGYNWALGGILAIKACDFEKIGGFPNFWGWGLEDNCLNNRCLSNKLTIDRSVFFGISDKRILRPYDGMTRKISNRENFVYKFEGPDTLFDISDLKYVMNDKFVDVINFDVPRKYSDTEFFDYDIRRGARVMPRAGYFRKEWKLF
jgi:hypothetical protein